MHDLILDGLKYYYEAKDHDSDAYNVYGALVNKSAVCKGFSYAMMLVLSKLDIWCTIIAGKGEFNHAWNVVRIDDEYYNVDLTFDLKEDRITHEYFNVPDRVFLRDHPSDKAPLCMSDRYDWYNVTGKICCGIDEISKMIIEETKSRSDYITFAYTHIPYDDVILTMKEAMRLTDVKSYSWSIRKKRQVISIFNIVYT